ncbi:hypothetical protein D1007_05312 [Hordeum vulgare]|nr:hypothetical protein D1007_05312 [Hordeum vulgare]
MASTVSPWSETPQDILGLVIDRLHSSPDHEEPRLSAAWSRFLLAVPVAAANRRGFQRARRTRHSAAADRARFRAVCRSWHLAMRQHVSTPRVLPWIILSYGYFFTPSDNGCRAPRRLPSLPKNARCIGSTDGWLALDCTDARNVHTYLLHNPFSNTTVPLPELDPIIANVSEFFAVRKVLLRKGRVAAFIDIVFLQGKLYGIAQAEDLASVSIDFDDCGMPTVTTVERLIKHPPLESCEFDVWSDADEKLEADGDMGDEDQVENGGEDHDEALNEVDARARAIYEFKRKTGDGMILEGTTYLEDHEVPHEPKDYISVNWHLIESRGKLLLVRRQMQWPMYSIHFTRKVEVFEANVNVGVWVPVSGGLDSQALFISNRASKSILACENVKPDTIYFIDTGEMFNTRSQSMSPMQRDIDRRESMWIFPPEIVV